MPTIGELVSKFVDIEGTSEFDRTIATGWLKAVRCADVDVDAMLADKDSLDKSEKKIRNGIRTKTVEYIKRFFDDRPEVVEVLDNLFSHFGLEDDRLRRKEYFSLNKLYSAEEIEVLLVKRLQRAPGSGRFTREEIADKFLTSTRTVNKYVVRMASGDPEMCTRILGQGVKLNPARGSNIPESTTHPLFLPLSMVELYALVDVLVEHSDDEVEGRIISSILDRVLGQATGYAKERLARIEGLKEALKRGEDPSGEKNLGEAVLFNEKEQLRAVATYIEDGKERACEGLVYRSHEDKTVIVIVDGGDVFHIPYQDLISLETQDE